MLVVDTTQLWQAADSVGQDQMSRAIQAWWQGRHVACECSVHALHMMHRIAFVHPPAWLSQQF
jgi:hypothetical protein